MAVLTATITFLRDIAVTTTERLYAGAVQDSPQQPQFDQIYVAVTAGGTHRLFPFSCGVIVTLT